MPAVVAVRAERWQDLERERKREREKERERERESGEKVYSHVPLATA